jgi:hypothetical protein
MTEQDPLRYPIGPFTPKDEISPEERAAFIETIARFPAEVRELVEEMGPEGVDTPYREGGWTVRQVVHHCADSHMQALGRFKMALTEDTPTIKPYHQPGWGELADSREADVETSLDLLDALHERWVILLRSMTDEDFARSFNHPEMGMVGLETNLQLYAWHCRHHLGHVRLVAEGK